MGDGRWVAAPAPARADISRSRVAVAVAATAADWWTGGLVEGHRGRSGLLSGRRLQRTGGSRGPGAPLAFCGFAVLVSRFNAGFHVHNLVLVIVVIPEI